MCLHALHTVHAVPDLRVAAGRLRDGVSVVMEQNTLFDQAIVSSEGGESRTRRLSIVAMNIYCRLGITILGMPV